MTRKRLLTASVTALVAAIVPITNETGSALGVELSTAACAEAGCGYVTWVDCICPDIQMPNRMPQCDE